MSGAPSIPNLLSLRGGRGRRGGRSHGPGRAGFQRSNRPNHDEIIQGTDTDAAVSRMSAVSLSYLRDPFAPYFVSAAGSQGPGTRRLPIINRGTYTRTTALDKLVEEFLSGPEPGKKQIISLGAGTDTRALRLFSRKDWGERGIVYHEIDFPDMSAKKLRIVRNTPAVRAVLGEVSTAPESPTDPTTPTQAPSPAPQLPPPRLPAQAPPPPDSPPTTWTCHPRPNSTYAFHALDLRSINPTSAPLPTINPSRPTLLLSECCLCYLPPPAAAATIAFFTAHIPALALALYEPVNPDDPFGRTMVANLAARGIEMPTLAAYRDVPAQEARLRAAGFDNVRALTVKEVWDGWVDEGERERVDGLEGLDEVEEWDLLAAHYVVAWGWRGRGFEGWEEGLGS